MRLKDETEKLGGHNEEMARKIVQDVAMRRLTDVPTDEIDFDQDYRNSLRAIAEGRFLTQADIDKKRAEIMAMDFGKDEDKEVVVAVSVENKEGKAEGLISQFSKAVGKVFGLK